MLPVDLKQYGRERLKGRRIVHTAGHGQKVPAGRHFDFKSVRIPQDPGQAGKDQAKQYVQMMAGFNIKAVPETGSKEARATPFAAQWQAGNVGLVIANWNEDYLKQLESFPRGKFKDMVDASANAFAEITISKNFNPRNLI
ncbi:MAG: phage terminase large subunit [Lachnospiraceae bacterium]|nr:phage terminase large subunit [Lachnospiraceae bacterium]